MDREKIAGELVKIAKGLVSNDLAVISVGGRGKLSLVEKIIDESHRGVVEKRYKSRGKPYYIVPAGDLVVGKYLKDFEVKELAGIAQIPYAVLLRHKRLGKLSADIIVAENDREAKEILKKAIRQAVSHEYLKLYRGKGSLMGAFGIATRSIDEESEEIAGHKLLIDLS